MDEYITTTEVASRLGITSARVRQLVLSGDLPAQKFGPVNMVKVGDLELIRNRRSVGRPKKEGEASGAAEIPTAKPTTAMPAKHTVAPKKAVTAKKGGKK